MSLPTEPKTEPKIKALLMPDPRPISNPDRWPKTEYVVEVADVSEILMPTALDVPVLEEWGWRSFGTRTYRRTHHRVPEPALPGDVEADYVYHEVHA